MSTRAQDVLYDSEATLRLVDSELGTLGPMGEAKQARSALASLPKILEAANNEIVSILESLRKNKSQLQSAAVERLQHTHSKLEEVNNTTESAASGILDSLDRAQGLLDSMDAEEGTPGSKQSEMRDAMRNELFAITEALQFQDITSQQIRYAANVLVELEDKLMSVLHLIDITGLDEVRHQLHDGDKSTYDPNATTKDREVRQHIADEVFTQDAPQA
jgi:chemotaxis regulatin CheY-phosphate phosphatase CheZ